MTQSELLKLAIEKAGGVNALSRLTDITQPRISEWKKGTEMRFDTMVKILNAVNIALIPIETDLTIKPTAEDCVNAIKNTLEKVGYFK
jgi:hypothetical protein